MLNEGKNVFIDNNSVSIDNNSVFIDNNSVFIDNNSVFIDNNSVVHNFTQAQLSDRFIGSIFHTQVINWMTLVCVSFPGVLRVISSDNHNSHIRDTKIVYILKLNWMLALVSFPVKPNRLP